MQTYEVAVAFPYAGRTRHVGERIEIGDPKHVELLILLGKIREPDELAGIDLREAHQR